MDEHAPARKLIILGAGRHGRVVRDVAHAAGYEVVGFLDDTRPAGSALGDVPVLGAIARLEDWLGESVRMHVALGDNRARLELARRIARAGGRLASVIHPLCDIAPSARIGDGVFIGSFSRVRPDATLLCAALVEGHGGVGTDSVLGEGAFLGPGAMMTAGTSLGEGAFVGAGACIVDGAHVGDWSVVGAGATVIAAVPERVLVVGTPARFSRDLT